jgi:hypothetical protein
MCTNTQPTLLWFRSIGVLYFLGVLGWMILWIASNDGIYSIHAPLLSIQFLYAGFILGIWTAVIRYPDDTIPTRSLMIAVFMGALITLGTNVLFGIWAWDLLNAKCQNPAAYGCVYVQICQTEQAYLITAVVFVGYFIIVDAIAIAASLLVLGKSYPSVSRQIKMAED